MGKLEFKKHSITNMKEKQDYLRNGISIWKEIKLNLYFMLYTKIPDEFET